MDKIKDLILERIQHSQILKTKCEKPIDYQELYSAKKAEKLRQIKENGFIEALFNFGQSSKCERQLFEVHSNEVMIQLNSQFNYRSKNRGLFSDIADMYINFFESIQLEARVEEIRIIAKYNLYQNFPFLCMLFKWLIEISRKLFLDVISLAKLQVLDQRPKKPSLIFNSRNVNNISSSQEQLKLPTFSPQISVNSTVTIGINEEAQKPFLEISQDEIRNVKQNQQEQNLLERGKLSESQNKRTESEDCNDKRKKIKSGLKGSGQHQQQQIKENQNEQSYHQNMKNINNNINRINNNKIFDKVNKSGNNVQSEVSSNLQQNQFSEKQCKTQPNQSEYSPKLFSTSKNNQFNNHKKNPSPKNYNQIGYIQSLDDNEQQTQSKDFIQIMKSLNLNEMDVNGQQNINEDYIENEYNSKSQINLKNTSLMQKSQIQDIKSCNNISNLGDFDNQAYSLINGVNNMKIQANSIQQKIRNGNEFIKYQIKPNAEKIKRRRRDMVFNNIKDCMGDVEFIIQKCNDYLINFYVKILLQRNTQIKCTIDDYRNQYIQNFNIVSTKLDPGQINLDNNKYLASDLIKNTSNGQIQNVLSQSTNNIAFLQKQPTQQFQQRSESTNGNLKNCNNNYNSNSNNTSISQRRTQTTLSPIHRPLGLERKSQRIMIDANKINNVQQISENQNLENQNMNNFMTIVENDRKRIRAQSQIGGIQQIYQQQDRSLSPLIQNMTLNQQKSKEFTTSNQLQFHQYQFIPQHLQKISPDNKKQNIKYRNCLIPSIKNFDVSEIESNSLNQNHIANAKMQKFYKIKQQKLQNNIMTIKAEKIANQSLQPIQLNTESNQVKTGDDGNSINLLQNNQFYHQNYNILKKIYSNDISLTTKINQQKKLNSNTNNTLNNQNNNVQEDNTQTLTQNHNEEGENSCIILRGLNSTIGNEAASKFATKNIQNQYQNQDSSMFEDDLFHSTPQYHLNKGKYRPPKNPKMLLQKIQTCAEEHAQNQNYNLIPAQQRNVSGSKQRSQQNNSSLSVMIGQGGSITSFQNDISQLDLSIRYTQPKKLQYQNSIPENTNTIIAQSRKMLTEPDVEIKKLMINDKNISNAQNQQLQTRSVSSKPNKEEVLQKILLKKLNHLIPQNKSFQPSNLNSSNIALPNGDMPKNNSVIS